MHSPGPPADLSTQPRGAQDKCCLLGPVSVCLFKECDYGHLQVARVPLPAGCTSGPHALASEELAFQSCGPGRGCTRAWHLLELFLPHHPVPAARGPHWGVDGRQLAEAQLCFSANRPSPTVLTQATLPASSQHRGLSLGLPWRKCPAQPQGQFSDRVHCNGY